MRTGDPFQSRGESGAVRLRRTRSCRASSGPNPSANSVGGRGRRRTANSGSPFRTSSTSVGSSGRAQHGGSSRGSGSRFGHADTRTRTHGVSSAHAVSLSDKSHPKPTIASVQKKLARLTMKNAELVEQFNQARIAVKRRTFDRGCSGTDGSDQGCSEVQRGQRGVHAGRAGAVRERRHRWFQQRPADQRATRTPTSTPSARWISSRLTRHRS